jgi:hypothetical protein
MFSRSRRRLDSTEAELPVVDTVAEDGRETLKVKFTVGREIGLMRNWWWSD